MIQVCLINVQVHHAGIWTADLSDVGVAETAAHLSGTAPVFDLRLKMGIAALIHAGDDRMALAGSLQVRDHLAYSTAGIQLAQPGRSIRSSVLRSPLLLDVHQYHRYIQIPYCGQHVV